MLSITLGMDAHTLSSASPPFPIFRSVFIANYLSHLRGQVLRLSHAPTEGAGEPRDPLNSHLHFQDFLCRPSGLSVLVHLALQMGGPLW